MRFEVPTVVVVVVLIGDVREDGVLVGAEEAIRKPLFPFIAITSQMISLGNFLEKSSQTTTVIYRYRIISSPKTREACIHRGALPNNQLLLQPHDARD
jgi:hypothetical protein